LQHVQLARIAGAGDDGAVVTPAQAMDLAVVQPGNLTTFLGCFIDFEELAFNPKENFLGGGVYGDVYIGKWLGASVAIKQFNKR
jgi:hypothetical protein